MNSAYRFVITAVVAPAALAAQQQQGKIAYPPTKTINHVDDYFGRKVSDPYRWMEDLNAAEVAQWVKAENAVTEKFLATLPMRDRFRSRPDKSRRWAGSRPDSNSSGSFLGRSDK